MTNVINLDDHREKDQDHLAGVLKCYNCGNEQAAVAPVGMTEAECDDCGAFKMRWKSWLDFEGPRFACGECGNDLFRVCEDKTMMCANCGVDGPIPEGDE